MLGHLAEGVCHRLIFNLSFNVVFGVGLANGRWGMMSADGLAMCFLQCSLPYGFPYTGKRMRSFSYLTKCFVLDTMGRNLVEVW